MSRNALSLCEILRVRGEFTPIAEDEVPLY